jgi:hypothetical protein
MSEPNRNPIIALIDAAVQLRLRPQIIAFFPLASAGPVAVTGRLLPWPWDQVFYGVGTTLAVAGAAFLLVVSTGRR